MLWLDFVERWPSSSSAVGIEMGAVLYKASAKCHGRRGAEGKTIMYAQESPHVRAVRRCNQEHERQCATDPPGSPKNGPSP